MRKIATPILGLALVAGLVLAGPAQAQPCVNFQGIEHCPIGDATLDSGSGGGLSVFGLGSEGNDGMSSHFNGGTFWQARYEFPDENDSSHSTRFSAVADNEVTSELTLDPVDGRYRVNATFTGAAEGSTYSVLVYRNGVFQGGLGGFSGSSSATTQTGGLASSSSLTNQTAEARIAVYVDGFYMGTIEEPWWWPWIHWGFGIANNGGCIWGMQTSSPVAVSLPDGRNLIGDEIRIEEDVRSSGHYPYLAFESIQTRSSAGSLRVTEESVQGEG